MSSLNGPGYLNLISGTFVPEEEAFEFVLENCITEPVDGWRLIKWTGEFKKAIIEWFFSGAWWVRVNDMEDKENGQVI